MTRDRSRCAIRCARATNRRTPASARISTWTRRGRRFVGIRLSVPDIRALPKAAPFAGQTYELRPEGELVTFRQTLTKPPPPGRRAAAVAWRRDRRLPPAPAGAHPLPELALSSTAAQSRPASRGNIITWEQRLTQRLEGKPIAYAEDRTPDVMEVRMDRESILYRTLWLFGIAFAAALLVLAGLIWLTMRTRCRYRA